MAALLATARVSLLPTGEGGLTAPLATGTKSLLLRFASGIEGDPLVTLGAVIDSEDRTPIAPGDRDRDVRLQFWADTAEVFVSNGASFELYYGREVGHGVVLRVVRDRS